MPSLPMGPKAGTNGKSTASSSTNEKKNTEKNGK